MTDIIKTSEKLWKKSKSSIEKKNPMVEIGIGAGLIVLSLPIPTIDPLDIAGFGLIAHGVHRIRESGSF